ncbi:hypothetical protein WR25_16003 [Diploscapter pachys]|uniref:FZ domain-containing protein n=1 Tax=Diploscapter pachys TaxID=2018661 RepID=A0A2A2KY34_9BILA|nr:hypothetical protein WR25_16003 [Diploscapter pachys]
MCVLKRQKGNRGEQTEGSEANAGGGALQAGHSDQVSDRTTLQQSEAAKNEKAFRELLESTVNPFALNTATVNLSYSVQQSIRIRGVHVWMLPPSFSQSTYGNRPNVSNACMIITLLMAQQAHSHRIVLPAVPPKNILPRMLLPPKFVNLLINAIIDGNELHRQAMVHRSIPNSGYPRDTYTIPEALEHIRNVFEVDFLSQMKVHNVIYRLHFAIRTATENTAAWQDDLLTMPLIMFERAMLLVVHLRTSSIIAIDSHSHFKRLRGGAVLLAHLDQLYNFCHVLLELETCSFEISCVKYIPDLTDKDQGNGDEGKSKLCKKTKDSWSLLSSERPSSSRCLPIPSNLTICYNMQYQQMRLPNLLEHETVNEVVHQSKDWEGLVKLSCHPDTQLFLCSLFAPICIPSMDKEILPCRSLCLAVKQGCEPRMQTYGFAWPQMLSCDKYPSDDMCIKPVNQQPVRQNHCTACNQVGTFENLVDHFCRSQLVVKGKLGKLTETHISIRNGRSLKKADRRRSIPETEIRLTADNSHCPCNVTASGERRVLVMANKQSDGHFQANLILPWKKDKNFKRAIHQFQRLNCKSLGREIRESASRRPQYYTLRRHNTGRYSLF